MGQVKPAKVGQIRSCQDWNFCRVCAVPDPGLAPWSRGLFHQPCRELLLGTCGQEPGWESPGEGNGDPPCRNPGTGMELFQWHRDTGHPSPVIAGTSSQRCGEGWDWDPSLQASLPAQAHLQCHGAALCVPFPVWSSTGGFKVSPLSVPPSALLFLGASGRAEPHSGSLSVFIFYAHLWGTAQI